MNRIEAGVVKWRNPFSGQELETSLKVEDVAAIVFWSKNFAPLLSHLPELHNRGYRFIFHFTITGLPHVFEPNVPPADETLSTFKRLADMFGPDAVLWRYDPILISSITSAEYHISKFHALASKLSGYTRRCYFSFPTFYGKTIRNTASLEQETGIKCIDPDLEEKIELISELAEIAKSYGITMFTCCNDALITGSIQKAHCIDAELIFRLYPEKMIKAKLHGTRKECGCWQSTDIGGYNTCPHGCVYCYANTNKEIAYKRWKENNAIKSDQLSSKLSQDT